MKVAVTGGSGRIGAFVVEELLAHGYDVRNIDMRPKDGQKAEYVYADLTDFGHAVGALQTCEAVVHLAAIPSPHRYTRQTVFVTNTVSTYHVLEACAALGITKIALASSVNAIGLSFSKDPAFDYFPVDEQHPSRVEDAYSLSKWVGEQNADAHVRVHPECAISSFRFHGIILPGTYAQWRAETREPTPRKHLWAYTDVRDAAIACRLALEAKWTGHQAFFITAKDTRERVPSLELAKTHYPNVPITGDLSRFNSFFNCAKAQELLRWEHTRSWRRDD